MNTQEKVQNQENTQNKFFIETTLYDTEKIDAILKNAKHLKDISLNGLIGIDLYQVGDNIMTLIQYRDKNKVILVSDDLEPILDKVYEQLDDQLTAYFGYFDNVEIYDYDMEYYRTFPNEELLQQYSANVDIHLQVGDVEQKIETVDVIQTYERDTDRGGIRVKVSLDNIIQFLNKYIESNFKRLE